MRRHITADIVSKGSERDGPQNSLADPIREFGGNRMVFGALCAPGGSALRSRLRRHECFEKVSAETVSKLANQRG